jgi:pSer/pThr/pTyr-binding forkhead associated (FHA) protein
MAFRLCIKSGKGQGREFHFSQAAVRIGRQPTCDLVLYDTGVSRTHCELIEEGGLFTLRDRGSSNGTTVNGSLVTECHLEDGDQVQIGPVLFIFHRLADSEPRADASSGHDTLFAPDSRQMQAAVEELKTMCIPTLVKDGSGAGAAPAQGLSAEAQAALERCTPTGSFRSSQLGLRQRWRLLPKPWRWGLIAAVLALLLACATAALIVAGRPVADRSAEVFPLGPTATAQRFGSGNVDVNTPDRVNFRFDYHGGRLVLTYAVGGIEAADELAILVNGKEVGFSPLAVGRWTTDVSLTVPRRLLRQGINTITFDNRLVPPASKRWGVAEVQVNETSLPAADPLRADKLFALGRAAFDARSVTPPNLWRSIGYFNEAKSLLEGLDEPPPRLQHILEAEGRARTELQNVYDSQMVAAEKALRFGGREQAAQLLRDLLRYFPDTSDTRHQQAKARLTQLGGGDTP